MSQLLQLFTILCLIIAGIHGFPRNQVERKLYDENRDLRLCVTRQVELDKCNDLKQLLLNNKYEYRLECCMNTVDVCIEKVREGQCDFVILEYQNEMLARNIGLRPYLYEEYSKKSYIVAVADQDVSLDSIRTRPVDLDIDDIRSVRAALYFDMVKQTNENMCDRLLPFQYDVLNSVSENPSQNRKVMLDFLLQKLNTIDRTESVYRNQEKMRNVQIDRDIQPIRFLRFNQLNEYDLNGKVLICPNLELRDLNSYENCNFDTGSVRAIYGRDLDDDRLYFINYFKQIVKILNEKHRSQVVNQWKLFGEYRGLRNVLFDDDTIEFSLMRRISNGFDESKLDRLLCVRDRNFERQMLDMNYFDRDINMMDRDRYRQYTDSQFNSRSLNGRMRQIPVLDIIRQRILYNVYDPNRQFSDLDRSQRLSDAVRFRQILNLNPYRQYISDVTSNRQLPNVGLDQLLNRYSDADRNRMLYDAVRERQLLDDYRNMDRMNDRQMYEANRNSELLDDRVRYRQPLNVYDIVQIQNMMKKFLDRDRVLNTQVFKDQDMNRLIYDNNREVLNDDQLRQLRNDNNILERFRDDDMIERLRYRQMYDNNRNREILNDQIRDVERNRDMDSYRRMYYFGKNYQTPDEDRFREISEENRYRQFPNYFNDKNYENYLRGNRYLDEDRYNVFRNDIDADRYRRNEDLDREIVNRKLERNEKRRDERRPQ